MHFPCESQRDDRAFLLAEPWRLRLASEALRDDAEFMLQAVRRSAGCAHLASARLLDDETFCREACRAKPGAFGYASARLRGDAAFALEVVTDGNLLACTPELRADRDFMTAVARKTGNVCNAAPSLWCDRAFALFAVDEVCPDALFYVLVAEDAEFDVCRSAALAAVKRDHGALRTACEGLRKLRLDAEHRWQALEADPEIRAAASASEALGRRADRAALWPRVFGRETAFDFARGGRAGMGGEELLAAALAQAGDVGNWSWVRGGLAAVLREEALGRVVGLYLLPEVALPGHQKKFGQG